MCLGSRFGASGFGEDESRRFYDPQRKNKHDVKSAQIRAGIFCSVDGPRNKYPRSKAVVRLMTTQVPNPAGLTHSVSWRRFLRRMLGRWLRIKGRRCGHGSINRRIEGAEQHRQMHPPRCWDEDVCVMKVYRSYSDED